MNYAVSIDVELPGWLTLDAVDGIVEQLGQTAWATRGDGHNLKVRWDAESEWVLRGRVQSDLDEVKANYEVELYGLNLDALMPVVVGA